MHHGLHVGAYVCGDPHVMSGISFGCCSTLLSGQGLSIKHRAHSLLLSLIYTASLLCLLSIELKEEYHIHLNIYGGSGDLNSAPLICMKSALTNELFFQS